MTDCWIPSVEGVLLHLEMHIVETCFQSLELAFVDRSKVADSEQRGQSCDLVVDGKAAVEIYQQRQSQFNFFNLQSSSDLSVRSVTLQLRSRKWLRPAITPILAPAVVAATLVSTQMVPCYSLWL